MLQLDTLQAEQALDDLCERRTWVAPQKHTLRLSGSCLLNLLEASASVNMMHACLEDDEQKVTLMVIAPIVRKSKQADVVTLGDILHLLIETLKRPAVHCVMFFSDNCANAQVQQIEDVATSSGRTWFSCCNTCFLCIPILRHPLNQDKRYELLAKDKVRMAIEAEFSEGALCQEMPSNLFATRKHLVGNKWLLQTVQTSAERYEREGKSCLQQSGAKIVREETESEYDSVVKKFLNADATRVHELPHMLHSDPCNIVLGGDRGDIIRIQRFGEDANVAYRVIV